MRLLIWEWCSSQPSTAGELAVEGFAMLHALASDAAALPGVDVVVVCEIQSSGSLPFPVTVSSPRSDAEMIELARSCDATLLVAPETDGLHGRLAAALETSGVRLLGASSTAISACSDKLLLASRLDSSGHRAIPTSALDASSSVSPVLPCVIKPRFGAGGCDTFVCRTSNDFEARRCELDLTAKSSEFVTQPLTTGDSASVGVIIRDGFRPMALPVVRQRIVFDTRIRYLGGETALNHPRRNELQAAALSAVDAFPGLRGYVGVDLIAPTHDDEPVCVCEVNPRVTTSYVGYRQISRNNLVQVWLDGASDRSIEFDTETTIQFDKAGTVRRIVPE